MSTTDPVDDVSKDYLHKLTLLRSNAELTTMAAADVLYEVMTLMVMKGPLSIADE